MSFVSGVPEPLPPGERLLWQGKPNARALAKRALHVDKVAIYFAGLALWQAVSPIWDNDAAFSVIPVLITLGLGTACIALLSGIAYLMGRTSLYAITSKRVVMRIGIALPVTYNLPFASLAAASVKVGSDGTGDIPMVIGSKDRIAYLNLWPHARPWHVAKPEPMLRCVANPQEVAEILGRAVTAFTASQISAPDAIPAKVHATSVPLNGRPPRLVVAQQR